MLLRLLFFLSFPKGICCVGLERVFALAFALAFLSVIPRRESAFGNSRTTTRVQPAGRPRSPRSGQKTRAPGASRGIKVTPLASAPEGRQTIAQDNPEGASRGRSPGKATNKTTIEARGPQGREPDCARNRRDRVATDSADEGLATAPVDALDLTGPQNPGALRQAQGRLGGTLNLIRSLVRPGPPTLPGVVKIESEWTASRSGPLIAIKLR